MVLRLESRCLIPQVEKAEAFRRMSGRESEYMLDELRGGEVAEVLVVRRDHSGDGAEVGEPFPLLVELEVAAGKSVVISSVGLAQLALDRGDSKRAPVLSDLG